MVVFRVIDPKVLRQSTASEDEPMGESQDKHVNHGPTDDGDGAEMHTSVDARAGEAAHSEIPGDEEIAAIDQAPLAQEVAMLKDALLRTRAEMDNLQKRAERELEKSRRFAVDGLLRELVPVIDSLDQGLESAAADSSLAEGLGLTRRQLVSALTRFGLEEENPVGQVFDPQWHEAMSMQPSAEHEPDTVIAVLQKGYRLHDRLLRPARVIVARRPD